jgi:bifunctional ADP-heptose synthase (sugar kinase/adenylyltransferase)
MTTVAEQFARYVDAIRNARVLVVGDVMLDRYWFGDVERISPEAPVPVVKIARTDERPGGAANVARNAAALGAQVTLIGVVAMTGAITGAFARPRVCARRCAVTHAADHRQTARDRTPCNSCASISETIRSAWMRSPQSLPVRAARCRSPTSSSSDCGKGGLADISRMIERARARRTPVLVAPKGEDYQRYRGATLLTPNRAEFREVAGSWRSEAELATKAQSLRAELALEALLITRSEEGMSLYTNAGAQHIPAQAREVYDVSGAGDTVIATIGALLGAGADLPSAVRIANLAASIVVGKLGTAVVHPEELAQ